MNKKMTENPNQYEFGGEIISFNHEEESLNFSRDGKDFKIFVAELKHFVANLSWKTTYISEVGGINISTDGQEIRIGCLRHPYKDFLTLLNNYK